MINVIVNGAMGRMGKMLCEAVDKDPDLNLYSGIDIVKEKISMSSNITTNSNAYIYSSLDEIDQVDNMVIIDFTFPKVTLSLAEEASKRNINMVVGSTGFKNEEEQQLISYSEKIGILFGYNMSLGVNLLAKAVELVASKLPYSYDVEIVETHHRFKKDSPSGTAIKFLRSIEKGRNQENRVVYGREGRDLSREDGEIGVHAVRGGDVVGDHEVMFLGQGERIVLKHVANSRMAFVSGAIMATKFLKDKSSGLFTMDDVLGF